MAYALTSADVALLNGSVPRRSRTRWLMTGCIAFGGIATAWTAIALVAPALMVVSLSTTPNLRAEDPFAPKVRAPAVSAPEPVQTASVGLPTMDPVALPDEIAENTPLPDPLPNPLPKPSATAFMPPLAKIGPQIAEGVPLRPANTLEHPLGPVLASLTSYADDADAEELTVPIVHSVETVAATPSAPPAEDASQAAPDITATASLPDAVPLPPTRDVTLTDAVPLPPISPLRRSGPVLASIAPMENRTVTRPAPDTSVSIPSAGGRVAVYDIAAHTVYMPNGERLEAHSGLGGMLDDPSTVHQKNRGVTPPHTYDLTPREQLFHGVAALRLTPSDGASVYGRVGLLAHTYMLGPRGDSNGCVSFKDYSRFLRAYRNGEVNKLVVVTGRSDASSRIASSVRKLGWWFTSSKN